MFQLPPAPNPADVRKFLLALKVPPAEARYFASAPHIDWAEDISEVFNYGVGRQVVSPQYPHQTLSEFFKTLAPELTRAGVTVRRLAKPKKGVPAGHDSYSAEFAHKKFAPVRHLFTRDPGGTAQFARARDLDAVLRAFELGAYLDLRWLDGDWTFTRIMSAREWDRVARLLGEGVRDRLFVRADRVPAERPAALQFQYELWTGATDKRSEWEQIFAARNYAAVRLSPAFLERHRAALDSFGAWEEENEGRVLSVLWAHPVGVDHSWVPLELCARGSWVRGAHRLRGGPLRPAGAHFRVAARVRRQLRGGRHAGEGGSGGLEARQAAPRALRVVLAVRRTDGVAGFLVPRHGRR